MREAIAASAAPGRRGQPLRRRRGRQGPDRPLHGRRSAAPRPPPASPRSTPGLIDGDGRRRGRPRPAAGRDPDPGRGDPDGGRARAARGSARIVLDYAASSLDSPSLKATAILPVKRFDAAKQRLGRRARRRAAGRRWSAAMVADVLEAIGAARTIERTIVVSGDPVAQELAAAAGAEVVADPDDDGHVEAALAGIARAEAEGAELRRRCCPATARCSTRASSTAC